ncbi:cytochrome C oxidase subunit IV family protein [Balneolaceae bacterium ANBcel3]|nr:cytochrome C oxidase subunit IV family protein [Balneolaceae bacterium ANBcel3]
MSSHYIPSIRSLMAVAGALLVLTFLTVAVTWIQIPEPFNVIVAVGIAAIKASLVALFFMNLVRDSLLNRLAFVLSFLFLAIFVVITLLDTLFRDSGFPVF